MERIVDVSENKQVMIFRQEEIIRCHNCEYYKRHEFDYLNWCNYWCSFDIDAFGYCSKAKRREFE